MFVDQNMSYASSQASGSDSAHFSFSSDSSVNSVYTPQSRRESFDCESMETAQFVDYGSMATDCYSTSAMSNDSLSNMSSMLIALDYSKVEPDGTLYNFDPSYMAHPYPNHGLIIPTDTPSLVPDLQSPMSELGSIYGDFINPSQTFLNGYEAQSPSYMCKYESSPMSAYAKSESPAASYMSFSDDTKSCPRTPCSTTPSRSSPLRQPIFEPLKTSIALHRVQNGSPGRRVQKKLKRHSNVIPNVNIHPIGTNECQFANCKKRFQRREHLRRHERDVHTQMVPPYKCDFCTKAFGRSDNLKSHIKLHADENNEGKKSARTKYHPEAKAKWESLNKKNKGVTLDRKLAGTRLQSS